MKNETALKEALLLEFWHKEAKGAETSLLAELPEAPGNPVNTPDRLELDLDTAHIDKVKELCNNSELLIFNFYSTVLTILTGKYIKADEFCFISPCGQFDDLKKSGFFLYKPLVDGNKSFKELFSKNKEFMLQSMEYSCGYEKIREMVRSAERLEEVGLVINDRSYPEYKPELLFKISASPAPRLIIEFRSKRTDRNNIELLGHNFISLLEGILQHMYEPVDKVEYLSKTERRLLKEFNSVKSYFPINQNIIELITENALKFPDKTAIVHGEEKISYSALMEHSNRYAGQLLSQGLKKEDKVVVMIGRSVDFAAAIIAVWIAGGAYVPVDIDYPAERIRLILRETGATHVFTSASALSKTRVATEQTEVVYINILEKNILTEELRETSASAKKRKASKTPKIGLQDLAYVIFTSGSTGKPKGVMIEHLGMINHIGAKITEMKMDNKAVVAQNAPQTFDISIWQLFSGLACGGTTIIYDKNVIADPADFLKQVNKDKVTVLELVPSYFIECLKALEENAELSLGGLTILILNAETLMPSMVERWFSLYPRIPIVNTYGATEVSDDISHYIMHSVPDTATVPVMKKPIQHIEVHIVNEHMQPVPVNVKGEILLSGIGVGRGYINDEVKTANSFLGPLPGITGAERTYRTGDIGRYLIDGTMEFLGRKDTQVKIRGNRIELGEIEHALMQVNGITNCTVLANQEQQYLAAYYQSELPITKELILDNIRHKLPEYMIPNYYVQMDKFPLTENGKINKKMLPDPVGSGMDAGPDYMEPRNIIERHLAEAYGLVLKRLKVGIKDDFFALGGDSIKAIQIGSQMKQKGYSLKIQDILRNPVIINLAEYVKAVTRNSDQAEITGIVPLSPIQAAFFSRNQLDVNHYNQSVLLESREKIEEDAVKAAFDKITLHHDNLRMIYKKSAGGWIQECKKNGQNYSFEIIELTEAAGLEPHCERIQSSIDLEKGPLFKVALFRGEGNDKLLLVSHHLVIDGVSWRILLEDFAHLYQQHLSNAEMNLPLKTDSFKYWQEKMVEYTLGEELKNEEAYWDAVETYPVKPLPVENTGGSSVMKDSFTESVFLSESLTDQLLTKCYKAYNTDVNDILITALCLSLDEAFNLGKVLLKLEGHGREYIGKDVDVTRTIGWFTTEYPVMLDMKFGQNKIRQLIEIKETLHRVPNKGIGYGILRYFAKKDYRLEPEIVFNYLGDFGADVGAKQNSGRFEFSNNVNGSTVSGNAIRECVLDVSGIIVKGRLNLVISYDTKQFSSPTIKNLLNSYRLHLEWLITSLSNEKEEKLTPVDLTFKGLTMEQLEELSNNLKYTY
ncbi:MAG: amino acid adenylation domain protein [Bacteroidetes bacterium]|nr:amino acid adenylation domain protein [Bacteroidota bacterium]